MSSPTPAFVKLIEQMVILTTNTLRKSTLESAGDDTLESTPRKVPVEFEDAKTRATELTLLFQTTSDIQHSDQAVLILTSLLDRIGERHPDRHYPLFHLAKTLCRRVEIQVSTKCIEPLVELHRILSRCAFLVQQAVSILPPTLDARIEYLAQLGHTITLWSGVLSCRWSEKDVLDLLAQMQSDQVTHSEEKITGFVSAVFMASVLSNAYGVTKESSYRDKSSEMYRLTLSSMKEVLPLDVLFKQASAPAKGTRIDILGAIQTLKVFTFVKEDLIPFVLQFMAMVLWQRLVEAPLNLIVGRHLAAIAFDRGVNHLGVEWLEQCLMLVWLEQKLRAPAPLDAAHMQETHTDAQGRMGQVMLAFLGLCVYVDSAADDQVSIQHPEQLGCSLMNEWLHLQRHDPTLKSLFAPPSFDHLLRCARTSPVVVLNLWGDQCDALILREGEVPKRVRLEGVTEDLAGKLHRNFRGILRSFVVRSRGNDDSIDINDSRELSSRPIGNITRRVMDILWKKIVKPIFDAMDLKPVENAADDPPCLTWFPTGPTSFFPLHAAGQYNTTERGSKTYHYVVSSYTPTLSVLADARDSLLKKPEPFKGILAVSQPYTAGQAPIPKTVDEVRAIEQAAEGIATVCWLNGEHATEEAVLRGMQASTWVHLACHAHQYSTNTSASAFLLANGEKLSLADISKHPSADGELAFLSACQTAAGDFDLSEEGAHLASGMLFAGYRGVIATRWSIRDEDAPVVAQEVYRRLLEGRKVNRTGAALALHHATRLLRDSVGEDKFFRWAPFTHFGI